MDVATMVAITNLNMVTVMAVQAANNVITIVNGERMEEDMDGSMLDQYMGKDCTVSLFNEVGAIKGKLMDIQAFEKGKNHLTSVDHMISNLKKKVDGMMH